MSEYEGIDKDAYAQGWRREFREAVDEALAPYPVGEEKLIEEIWVKKRRENPVHDYRVVLRP